MLYIITSLSDVFLFIVFTNKLIAVPFQHADYDRGTGTYPNDIALLKLYLEGRSLTSNIIPVATGSNTFAGQSCTISGWGVTGEQVSL